MDISCAFAPVTDTPDHIRLAEELGFRRAWAVDTPAVRLDIFKGSPPARAATLKNVACGESLAGAGLKEHSLYSYSMQCIWVNQPIGCHAPGSSSFAGALP